MNRLDERRARLVASARSATILAIAKANVAAGKVKLPDPDSVSGARRSLAD